MLYIVETKTIFLDDGGGANVVAIDANDQANGALKSDHTEFIWDKLKMATLVYWLMDGE